MDQWYFAGLPPCFATIWAKTLGFRDFPPLFCNTQQQGGRNTTDLFKKCTLFSTGGLERELFSSLETVLGVST